MITAMPENTPAKESSLFSPLLSNASILIVDDEPGIRNFLIKTIGKHCASIEFAASAKEATEKLDQSRFDIVILDNRMPGQTGIEWLAEQRQIGFFGEAILITAFADLETAIEALRAGAIDIILKPFRSNQILRSISNCLARTSLKHENTLLRHELGSGVNILRHRQELIGRSDQILQVKEYLQRAARLDSNILIFGETGTGKEVAARMLHSRSSRSQYAFVPITCAAFIDDSFADVLFGRLPVMNQEGQQNDGLLLPAEGGTLFLDDVDELSSLAQAALIRVIETGCIRPVNAARDIPVNLRIIASTSKDLLDLVKRNEFREDLYYRLNVLNISMPPLRDRPVDVIDLATMFITNIARELNIQLPEITQSTKRKLINYPWPGNVRELRNHIERGLINNDLENGLEYELRVGTNDDEIETLAGIERKHILNALEICGGNRAEAARRLGVSRKTIDRKCQSWNV